jgi:hypothetical protein
LDFHCYRNYPAAFAGECGVENDSEVAAAAAAAVVDDGKARLQNRAHDHGPY